MGRETAGWLSMRYPAQPILPEDLAWAADLMERRRQVYEAYSPVFWKPARGVTKVHAGFLATQLARDGVAAFRTEAGFIIAERRGVEAFVDDFAVEHDDLWLTEGLALLLAAWEALAGGAQAARVATAAADRPKVQMLTNASLRLDQQWWVKAVVPLQAPRGTGRLDLVGLSGLLGPAPPVYDPGGPVLLADQVSVETQPEVIEQEAARAGAVLAIVPLAPGVALEAELVQRQWAVASQWYAGCPLPPPGS